MLMKMCISVLLYIIVKANCALKYEVQVQMTTEAPKLVCLS